MAGGSRCERTGSRIAGESFKQGIVAGHDRQSQQIRHIERERDEVIKSILKSPKVNPFLGLFLKSDD